MPLRDSIKIAEQTSRQLGEALAYEFAPTADRLRRLLREQDQGTAVENTISDEIKKFLEQDRQLQSVYEELIALCIKVDKGLLNAASQRS